MQIEDELLDVQYVAARLHVNPRTVLRMVEREELPAIRVARRLRFRRSDLENYLRTHLYTSSQNGKSAKQIIPETVELSQEAEEEESDVPAQPGEVASESALKEQARSLGAQGAKLRKQAAQLEIEQKLLEIEQKRLDLQKQHLELHTRRINHALDTATRMVSMLHPEADAKTKAFLLQSLLPGLLQLDFDEGLVSALSASQTGEEEGVSTPNRSNAGVS
jgi:excisionase family DNA binding protein